MVNMPHWPIAHRITPNRVDLSDMINLISCLGNPHLKLPPIIHIAGTNGKGSTVSFLKAIFESPGKKVHSYTSPHLLEFNERIVIAGTKISDGYLFELCERVRIISEREGFDPTFFEATTAAAFMAFAENAADTLLLETGLGGRLDPTNIVVKPLATIITPISYDHMEKLGSTLSMIAGEKAGIIKQGVPCFISAQVEEAMNVFLAKCESVNSESIVYGYDFAVDKKLDEIILESREYGIEKYPLPILQGDHQILNAAVCIMLAKRMGINNEHIALGLKKAVWPGRIQKIPNRNIWLDGAHNAGGAQVLSIWVRENLQGATVMILGMTKNRDVTTFLKHFNGVVQRIFCVRVLSEPSSYSAEKLAELAGLSGIEAVACDDLDEAIKIAQSTFANIVITGSLFLVADFKKSNILLE